MCKINFYNNKANPLYYAGLLFLEGKEIKDLVIPEGVTGIGDYAFWGCDGLTSVTIPNSVTSIGYRAFSGCSDLISIKVDEANQTYDSRNNCNAIIETETNELIVGCKSTVIPNSVESIGDYAFHDCSGLTSVTIPNGVTSIGEDAFSYCSGLTSVVIGNSVTSIGWYAFYDCSGLTSVTIGNSVTSIGESAFYNCDNLMEVYVLAGSPPACGLFYPAFSSRTYEKATLYVPEGSVSLYKSTSPWSSFSNIKAIPKK